MYRALIILSFISAWVWPLNCAYSSKSFNDAVVSIKVNGGTFSQVVDIVENQLGCSISYDESLASYPVSGEFNKILVEKFLSRILKGKNILIITNEYTQEISIKAFGNPSSFGGLAIDNYSALSDPIDLMIELKSSEVTAILRIQEENKQRRLNNPNTIDPSTGMRLSHINEILSLQEENKRQRLSDLSLIDPSTGLKMSEINEILRIQEESKIKRKNSDNQLF